MNGKRWKLLFLLLFGINLIIFITLLVFISIPAKDEQYLSAKLKTDGYVPFTVQTNKQDLNDLINHYLNEEGLALANDYKVILNDAVILSGSVPVFSQNIQIKLTFEPKALENGDIVLQQKSVSVGQLQLPVSYVLKFISEYSKLPKWVHIQPNEEKIYVSLQNMKLKSNFKVKVDEINLKEDDIRFTLMVPVR